MSTAPRPILFGLAGAVVVAAFIGWFVGSYLGAFGVPVAARVLISLLMVPASVALFLAAIATFWSVRERRRSHAILARADTSGRPLSHDWQDAMIRMQELEGSNLVRVIGVGRTVSAGETAVDFLAVEVREAGCVITIRASGASIADSPDGAFPPWPNLSVADDVETRYIVVPGGGGGGGQGRMQYELRCMPGPPATATRLTLSIHEFSPSMWPFDMAPTSFPDSSVAPWRVSVEL